MLLQHLVQLLPMLLTDRVLQSCNNTNLQGAPATLLQASRSQQILKCVFNTKCKLHDFVTCQKSPLLNKGIPCLLLDKCCLLTCIFALRASMATALFSLKILVSALIRIFSFQELLTF